MYLTFFSEFKPNPLKKIDTSLRVKKTKYVFIVIWFLYFFSYRVLLYTFILRQMIIFQIWSSPRNTKWNVNPVRTTPLALKVQKFSNVKVVQSTGKRAKISLWKPWKRSKNIRAKAMFEQSPNKSKMTAFLISLTHHQSLMIPMLILIQKLKIYWRQISKLAITSGIELFQGLCSSSLVSFLVYFGLFIINYFLNFSI